MIAAYTTMLYMFKTRVLSKDSETLENEDYKGKYGPLYDGYDTTSRISKGFLIAEISRKLLYVLLLVFVSNYPEEQLYGIIAVQTVFFIAITIVRPYEEKQMNVVKCFMEFGLLLTFSVFAPLMYDDFLSDDNASIVTWIGVGLLAGNVGSVAVVILVLSLIGLLITIF